MGAKTEENMEEILLAPVNNGNGPRNMRNGKRSRQRSQGKFFGVEKERTPRNPRERGEGGGLQRPWLFVFPKETPWWLET